MIARFDNIDSGTFHFNGVPYYKIFIPVAIGDVAVKVVSIYDSKLELLPSTNITDIKVNNVTYESAASLVNILKGVVFDYPNLVAEIDNATTQIENTTAQIEELEGLIEEKPGSIISNNNITTLTPLDARLSINHPEQTGSFKIRLPQNWTNTMMTLEIIIFDYGFFKPIKAIISGYNYTKNGGFWHNTGVMIIASNATRDFPVRFGHDGVKPCIYIGELNTKWQYPQVIVSKAHFCYYNVTSSLWLTGWSISLETTSFLNISQHHTNNLIQGK